MQEEQRLTTEPNGLDDDEVCVTLAELEDEAALPAEPSKRKRRRKRLYAVGLLFALLASAGVGGYFMLRGNRVDLRANKRIQPQPANGSDIKRAAYESLSGALTEPAAAQSPGVNIGTGQTNDIAMAGVPRSSPKPLSETDKPTAPPPVQEGIAATLAPPPEFLRAQPAPTPNSATGAGNAQAVNGKPAADNKISSANPARSLRFAAAPAEEDRQPSNAVRAVHASAQLPIEADTAQTLRVRPAAPSFGAMLPVRLLGVLYTLRTGALARLELMRDIRTQQGQLKRGTVLVGNVAGGDLDRAYVQIKGFIEPESQRFIKLEGEVLGSDGGAGLRGKRRRVSSPWLKVLDRTAQAGTQIATSIFGRQNSSVIIASDPYGTYRTTSGQDVLASRQDRAFVEVPAGAVGFVLVTTLPKTEESDPYLANATSTELPDEEVAELLANADPARIRAALPRMNPELRRAAQGVLKELER